MLIEDLNKFFKKIRLIHIQPATVLIYRSIFILTGTIKSALGANPKMYEISREDGWKLGMEVNEGEEYMGVHRGYKVSVVFHIYK
uniref:Uncharacterized protein n=1 Tax=Acrobeloides nanus TaxID=290746 RepID=A0A914DTG3_9BILA